MTANQLIHQQLVKLLRRYLSTDNQHGPNPLLHILTASNGKFHSNLISTSGSMFEGESSPTTVLNSFATMMGTDRGQVLAAALLGDDLVGIMFTCTAVQASLHSTNIVPVHTMERYGFACTLIDDEEAFVVHDMTSGVTEERDLPRTGLHSSLMESLVSLLLAMDDARHAPAPPDILQVAHGMLSGNDPLLATSTAHLMRTMGARPGKGITPGALGRGVGSASTVFMLQDAVRHD